MKKILYATVALLIVLIFFSLTSNKEPVVSEGNWTYTEVEKTVQFCMKSVTYKQVLLSGRDIIEKIASLSNENLKNDDPLYPGAKHVCNELAERNVTEMRPKIIYGSTLMEGGQKIYTVDVDDIKFIINLDSNYVFEKIPSTQLNDPGNFGVLIPIGQLK